MHIRKFKIADLVLEIDGPDSYIHRNFETFSCSGDHTTDFKICFKTELCSNFTENVSPMIDAKLLKIYDLTDRYVLYYPQERQIKYSYIFKEKDMGTLLVSENALSEYDCLSGTFAYRVYLAIRDLFFVFMQRRNCIAVHSASIIYHDKAYLFSAPSGVGKTTHTTFWNKLYHVDILDGDVAALYFDEKHNIYAYGLPWCGTSNLFQNKKVPLGGIFFLQRGIQNSVKRLNLFEAILQLSARCFTPTWTSELAEKNIVLAEKIAEQTLCAVVSCLPNEDAAQTVKNFIDNQKESS